jgi:hypothetical protein
MAVTWLSRDYHVTITWLSRDYHMAVTWLHMAATWLSRGSVFIPHFLKSVVMVKWFCAKCDRTFEKRLKYCTFCKQMIYFDCAATQSTGRYTYYYRHRARCRTCGGKEWKNKQKQRITDSALHEKGMFALAFLIK